MIRVWYYQKNAHAFYFSIAVYSYIFRRLAGLSKAFVSREGIQRDIEERQRKIEGREKKFREEGVVHFLLGDRLAFDYKKLEAGAAAYFYGAWKRKRRGTEKRRRNLRMVGRKADWIQWTILTCQVILTVRRERRGEIYLLENIPPRTKNSWERGGKREIGGKGGGSSRYNTLSKITFQSRSGQLESFL